MKIFSTATAAAQRGSRARRGCEFNLWIGTTPARLSLAMKNFAANAPVKDISCCSRSGRGLGRHVRPRLARWLKRWTASPPRRLTGDDIGYLVEDEFRILAGSYEGLMRVGGKSLVDFAATPKKFPAHLSHARMFRRRQPPHPHADGGCCSTIEDWWRNPASCGPTPTARSSSSPAGDGGNAAKTPESGGERRSHAQPENEQLEIRFTALIFPRQRRAVRAGSNTSQGRDKSWTDVGARRGAFHHHPLSPGKFCSASSLQRGRRLERDRRTSRSPSSRVLGKPGLSPRAFDFIARWRE